MPIQTNGNSISCHITQFQNYFIVTPVTTNQFSIRQLPLKKILSHTWQLTCLTSPWKAHLHFASCTLGGKYEPQLWPSRIRGRNRMGGGDTQPTKEKKPEEPTPLGYVRTRKVAGGRSGYWARVWNKVFHTQKIYISSVPVPPPTCHTKLKSENRNPNLENSLFNRKKTMNRGFETGKDILEPENCYLNRKIAIRNRKRYSRNRKIVILTGKEHDTPLYRDLKPKKVLLKPKNCDFTRKLSEIGSNRKIKIS